MKSVLYHIGEEIYIILQMMNFIKRNYHIYENNSDLFTNLSRSYKLY